VRRLFRKGEKMIIRLTSKATGKAIYFNAEIVSNEDVVVDGCFVDGKFIDRGSRVQEGVDRYLKTDIIYLPSEEQINILLSGSKIYRYLNDIESPNGQSISDYGWLKRLWIDMIKEFYR